MADDRKRDNKIVVRVTDREFLDLGRNAACEERDLAAYCHFILRRSLYGTVGVRDCESNETLSGHEPLRGSD